MKKITVEQFEKEYAQNPSGQCVDVRERAEYSAEKIEGFTLYPLSKLSEKTVPELDRSKTTYLLCRSGNRACQAADKLEKIGFKDLRVIEGGLSAWSAAGKPVARGISKIWSLERQVRFSAGVLVGLGIALSISVHPYWLGLSAFVAAGLIFSAVTDTCGMAMILARMPWNQR